LYAYDKYLLLKRTEEKTLNGLIPKLKIYLADLLTCNNIKLTPGEISIRLIKTFGNGMIGAVEVEIVANAFPQRIKNEDQICLDVRKFIQTEYPNLGEIIVPLIAFSTFSTSDVESEAITIFGGQSF